jgi:hypothetical protein
MHTYNQREEAVMKKDKVLLMLVVIVGLLACGKVKSSDRAKAERVFTDQAGYTCFIVRDEDGKAVGGNCIKE